MKQDLDDAGSEARMVEDKARSAMMDAAKLADELRMEQDNTGRLDNERRLMEAQVKDLQARLDDAEAYALKNGKKAAQKLENRIRELENELDGEQRRLGDSSKNLRKSERRIKELEFQAEEDRKQHEHMQDLVDKFQQKVIEKDIMRSLKNKCYKKMYIIFTYLCLPPPLFLVAIF